MSSTKSAVLVALGFVGAFGAGFWTGQQNGSEPTPPPAKLASDAPVSPEAANLTALEKELAVERTARARAQAACETAEKELARVKTLAPASPVEATTGAASAPASSASETAHAAKGDLASKVRSLEAEADAAVRSKSMKKIAEVLKEAVKLERDGWPVVIRLLTAMGKMDKGGFNEQDPKVQLEFMTAIQSETIATLIADALGKPGTYDTDFRVMAVNMSGGWGPGAKEKTEALVKSLPAEKDEKVAQAIAQHLSWNPQNLDALAEAARTNAFPSVRATIVEGISRMPGDDGFKALQQLAQGGNDEARVALDFAQKARQVPVAGYLVRHVPADSVLAEARLLEGDLLTRLNGTPLDTEYAIWTPLQGLNSGTVEELAITWRVLRAGQKITCTCKMTRKSVGEIWQNLHFARPAPPKDEDGPSGN